MSYQMHVHVPLRSTCRCNAIYWCIMNTIISLIAILDCPVGLAKSNTNTTKDCLFQCMNGGDLLKTHLTGVIAHGQRRFWGFLDLLQYPHDSNMTINTIIRVLHQIAQSMVGTHSQL